MAIDNKEEGRLARWSRLKHEETTKTAVSAEAVEQSALEPAPEAKEVPEIRPEDLPDVDSLDENSDFTPFLQEGVPEELARLALRKLWRSNPMFANLDGLNDYDEDFSVFEAIKAATDTAYKVGKGFMTDEDVEADEEDDVEDDGDLGEGEDGDVIAAGESTEAAETPAVEELSTDKDTVEHSVRDVRPPHTPG